MSKNIQTLIKAIALSSVLLLAAGCTTGLQQQIDSLDARVDDLAQSRSSAADAAAASAAEARQMAAAAQATADEALAAAALNAACCDATNEKIDRMFQRSQSK